MINIYGLDFTSAPSRQKAITCAVCRLDGDILFLEKLERFSSFDAFEAFLMRPGPWLAGMDFPFGQPRQLIENLGWPNSWAGYVRQISNMGRQGFVDALKTYRDGCTVGDKHHLRRADILAKSCSPMMLYGIPVGKMFFEGAPRLLKAGVNVPPVNVQNDSRTVIEAYPALVVRRWIGSRSYKNDTKTKQTMELRSAREELVNSLRMPSIQTEFGFEVQFGDDYAEAFIRDGTGDQIDALLCAIQAGWAYTLREQNYGIPVNCDPLEGWIVDPTLLKY